MITCSRCKQSLPAEAFSPNKRHKNGYQSACRACCRSDYAERVERAKQSPEAIARAAARLQRQRQRYQDSKVRNAAAKRHRYHSDLVFRTAQIKRSMQWTAEHPDEVGKIRHNYRQRCKAKADAEPCPII